MRKKSGKFNFRFVRNMTSTVIANQNLIGLIPNARKTKKSHWNGLGRQIRPKSQEKSWQFWWIVTIKVICSLLGLSFTLHENKQRSSKVGRSRQYDNIHHLFNKLFLDICNVIQRKNVRMYCIILKLNIRWTTFEWNFIPGS